MPTKELPAVLISPVKLDFKTMLVAIRLVFVTTKHSCSFEMHR